MNDKLTKVYTLDGNQFHDFKGFISHFNHVFFQDKPVWHGNLNAFNDILRGGFGQPEEGYTIRWIDSEISRQTLNSEYNGLFEELIEIINIHGEGGEEHEDNVKLLLE